MNNNGTNHADQHQVAIFAQCRSELAHYIDPDAYRTFPENAAGWVYGREATERQEAAERLAEQLLRKMAAALNVNAPAQYKAEAVNA